MPHNLVGSSLSLNLDSLSLPIAQVDSELTCPLYSVFSPVAQK